MNIKGLNKLQQISSYIQSGPTETETCSCLRKQQQSCLAIRYSPPCFHWALQHECVGWLDAEPWRDWSRSADFWFHIQPSLSLLLRQWLLTEGSRIIFLSTDHPFCNNGTTLQLVHMQTGQVIAGKIIKRYFSFLIPPFFHLVDVLTGSLCRWTASQWWHFHYSDDIIHSVISSEASWRAGSSQLPKSDVSLVSHTESPTYMEV